MVVMLVEVTSVDQLVERLKKGKFKGKEEIVRTSQYNVPVLFVTVIDASFIPVRANAADDDDDIVAGPQRMSLKDPVGHEHVLQSTNSDGLRDS